MSLRQLKVTSFLLICMQFFALNSNAQNSYKEREIEVSLRMIGDQVLLSLGDSISRVLPIVKEKNQYKIQFESEFEFTPEQLVATINRVVKETKLANRYVVEIEQCYSGELVYSFMMDNLEKTDIIPCKSRVQPKSCYNLLFTLMTENDEDNVIPISKNKLFEGTRWLYYVIPLLFIIISFFFLKKKRNQSANDINLIPLGKYHFDKRNAVLLIKQQSIELTSKEADLLLLLYNAVNSTVERKVILNEVWGDEGGYVGRTLDVFISKLRKKLQLDTSVKIVNVRGVGYKLVLDV